MKLVIRPFTAADAAVTRAIFYQSIHELATNDYSPAQLDAWAPVNYNVQQWAAQRSKADTFVATVDGISAGFADLIEGSGQTLLGEILIDMLFVRPPYQGQGIASALLAQVQEEARTRGATALVVQASKTARAFFERHGFKVKQENQVPLRGEVLTNFTMKKKL
ncbi:GNAT family N-acetyltransferase [Rothia amarae]|uniref:GNAT family N-acetyltransferase n=1 Tax=Rothia amarae TaxID=169480 RepID=A0A7H2BK72_9MICC|nr:GNAT family N-acetyltransferase [Rothia amarae]QNV40068.1 GNAT family N-acetyltransferase [Rothia amarae]